MSEYNFLIVINWA